MFSHFVSRFKASVYAFNFCELLNELGEVRTIRKLETCKHFYSGHASAHTVCTFSLAVLSQGTPYYSGT